MTKMGEVINEMKKTGGYAWSTDLAASVFGGDRKETNRWMKAVLVADGMVTFTTSAGSGNFYSLTKKGRAV